MDAELYVLVSRAMNQVKIGQSLGSMDRSKQLTKDWGQFNLDESYYVKDTKSSIISLEKTLHFLFVKWRIKSTDNRKSGHTEWFHIDCLDAVINEIDRINALHGSCRTLRKGIDATTAKTDRETQKKSKIADVLFKEYRFRVLSFLLQTPNNSYATRELSRLIGVSVGSFHREVKLLADSGLLTKTEVGNQVKYQANTLCPAFPHLVALLENI